MNNTKRVAELECQVAQLQVERAAANRQADALLAYVLDLLQVLAEQLPDRTPAQRVRAYLVYVKHRRVFEALQDREMLEKLSAWKSAAGAEAKPQ